MVAGWRQDLIRRVDGHRRHRCPDPHHHGERDWGSHAADPTHAVWQAPISWSNHGTRLLAIRRYTGDVGQARPVTVPVMGTAPASRSRIRVASTPAQFQTGNGPPDDSSILGAPTSVSGTVLDQELLDPGNGHLPDAGLEQRQRPLVAAASRHDAQTYDAKPLARAPPGWSDRGSFVRGRCSDRTSDPLGADEHRVVSEGAIPCLSGPMRTWRKLPVEAVGPVPLSHGRVVPAGITIAR